MVRQRRIPSQPGATPRFVVRKIIGGLKAHSTAALEMARASSPLPFLGAFSWGVAPGWDEAGPLALVLPERRAWR